MNKAQSKYANTALRMDRAFLSLLERKDPDYITVKELCQTAGVHRSTFYLHYETMDDLLNECAQYLNEQCFRRYGDLPAQMAQKIAAAPREELVFITPEYLLPFLDFVGENRRLFELLLTRPSALNASRTFSQLFQNVFSPILDRFSCPEDSKLYILSFYISGLMGVVSRWLQGGCAERAEKIANVCISCVLGGPGPRFGLGSS